MGQFEDFLKGQPLNEELARIKDGATEEAGTSDATPRMDWEIDDPNRPLTQDEREDLARLTTERGWLVLMRLRKRTCADLERAATLASRQSPLQNAERIATGWAQLAIYEQAIETEAALIAQEIAQLKRRGKTGESVLDEPKA